MYTSRRVALAARLTQTVLKLRVSCVYLSCVGRPICVYAVLAPLIRRPARHKGSSKTRPSILYIKVVVPLSPPPGHGTETAAHTPELGERLSESGKLDSQSHSQPTRYTRDEKNTYHDRYVYYKT